MPKCSWCGKDYPDGQEFCPSDNTVLEAPKTQLEAEKTWRLKLINQSQVLNKRTVIAAAAVVLMLVGATVWSFQQSRPSEEPVYKGKGALEYFHGYSFRYRGGDAKDLQDAFRFFGTNVVPYVRAGLRAKNTSRRRALLWLKHKAPWLNIQTWPASLERYEAVGWYLQILTWDDWGDASAACVPEVRALMENPKENWATKSMATNVIAILDSKKQRG
jgi:hypothetical protein